jgi:GT2 family glycosyltransferase
MNKGIREASGQIIIRMDAHAGYPPDYVPALVGALKESGADNVVGVWVTKARSEHPKAVAIARALAHPFGIGNAGFRTGVEEVTETDTVPFGCYRRSVFRRFGLYDERLHRNQDIELNKRIRRQGGKILLFPQIHCTYFARDTFRELWKNNFATGRWVILTAFFTGHLSALSLRHFVPFFFVSYLIILLIWTVKGLFAGLWHPLETLAGLPLLLYLLILSGASRQIGAGYPNKLFPFAPLSFLTLHLSYGLGSWRGILDLLKKEIRTQRHQQPPFLK